MIMNFRSKTTAMVLCFFLGLLGAHWFYLGRRNWGLIYLVVSLFALPLALVLSLAWATIVVSLNAESILGGFGIYLLVLGWLAHAGILLATIYDFFCLLCMEPARFDIEYNR
jgi:hypothetical protein